MVIGPIHEGSHRRPRPPVPRLRSALQILRRSPVPGVVRSPSRHSSSSTIGLRLPQDFHQCRSSQAASHAERRQRGLGHAQFPALLQECVENREHRPRSWCRERTGSRQHAPLSRIAGVVGCAQATRLQDVEVRANQEIMRIRRGSNGPRGPHEWRRRSGWIRWAPRLARHPTSSTRRSFGRSARLYTVHGGRTGWRPVHCSGCLI